MFALHKATMKMNVDMTKTLLEAHAEVNLPDGNGQTPLHMLCKKLNWRFDIAPEMFVRCSFNIALGSINQVQSK